MSKTLYDTMLDEQKEKVQKALTEYRTELAVLKTMLFIQRFLEEMKNDGSNS